MPTGVARLEMTAQGGRAAVSNVFQHRFLGGRRVVRTTVVVPVRTYYVGDLETRPTFGGQHVRSRSAERLGGRSPQEVEWAFDPTDVFHADVCIDLGGTQRPVAK